MFSPRVSFHLMKEYSSLWYFRHPEASPGFKRKDMRLEMTCFCFPYSVVFLRKRAIQARKSYVAGLIL